MDAERWMRVAHIFELVSERPLAERDHVLSSLCGDDAALRRDVESLLAQDVSRDGVIERVAADAASVRPFPTTIGRYRILGLIGEGGMGAVYEAEQDQPHRTVALKIVKSVLAAPVLLRRFAHETEALGRLQHPGIARIYDAGTAECGWGAQPYFAMELIRGLSLLEYANRRQLGTADRVELMIKVCEAVDHAHQRGIIHRDLKPGNILVDESGQPKVLDFGVARIADLDASATQQTKVGDLVGTLMYMSPEQMLADPAQLDARSDVYSLAVVCYELLAGRLPYRAEGRLTEAVRTVREDEPLPLGAVNRAYRGDLQIILAKALEKDPARRYGSAGDLAADLRRYLSHQPISAVPPTIVYQTRKFVRRHWTLVSAASAVFAVLVAGIAVSATEAIRATRARDRALRAEATAKAVNDFLESDVLAQASAAAQAGQSRDPDPDLRVRTALDRAAARISGKFEGQPLVEASIRRTIGKAYIDLGLYANAQPQLERAVDLRTRALGPADADTLAVMDELATAYSFQSKYAQSEPLLRTAFDAATRALGKEDETTLAIMNDLALLISAKGDYAGSARMLSEVLTIQHRLKGDEDAGTLVIMNNLASQYDNLGRFADAEALRVRVVAVGARVRGPNHPDTLSAVHNLGVLYRKEGKYADAEKTLKASLEGRRRIYGDDHTQTLADLNSLSLLYQAEGRYDEAEPLVLHALESSRKTLGEEHVETLRYLNNLADLYRKEGKSAQAEATYVRLLDARRRVLGSDHPNTVRVLTSLGELKFDQQADREAEPLLREALQAREKKSPDSWERYYVQSLVGAIAARHGRAADGAALLASGYQGLLAHAASIPAESRPLVDKVRILNESAAGR